MSRLVLGSIVALALLVAPAGAADPESGSVSASAPSTEWKGTAPGYGFSVFADTQGGIDPCEQPYCDSYTLDVKDKGTLTITLTTDSGAGFTTVEVEKPDGSKLYNGGNADDPKTVFKISNAPVGAYVIETETNESAEAGQYTGNATLTVAGAAAPTPPPAAGPPTPATGPAPAPAPTGATLQLKTRSAKAGKKVKLAISSSGPVSNVVAQIRKGSKVVAAGKLAKLSGSAKVTVKAKKALKAGGYTVVLRGTDASGAKVGSTTKLKLKK